jgi:hypothetical protein
VNVKSQKESDLDLEVAQMMENEEAEAAREAVERLTSLLKMQGIMSFAKG